MMHRRQRACWDINEHVALLALSSGGVTSGAFGQTAPAGSGAMKRNRAPGPHAALYCACAKREMFFFLRDSDSFINETNCHSSKGYYILYLPAHTAVSAIYNPHGA